MCPKYWQGTFCTDFLDQESRPIRDQLAKGKIAHLEFWHAFAVGLSIFIMVATDTEHPPAAGTALGVVTLGFSMKLILTVLISISFLAGVHYLFKNRLRDLTL